MHHSLEQQANFERVGTVETAILGLLLCAIAPTQKSIYNRALLLST